MTYTDFTMHMLLLGWARTRRANSELIQWEKGDDMVHVNIGISEMPGGTQYFAYTYVHCKSGAANRMIRKADGFYHLTKLIEQYDT